MTPYFSKRSKNRTIQDMNILLGRTSAGFSPTTSFRVKINIYINLASGRKPTRQRSLSYPRKTINECSIMFRNSEATPTPTWIDHRDCARVVLRRSLLYLACIIMRQLLSLPSRQLCSFTHPFLPTIKPRRESCSHHPKPRTLVHFIPQSHRPIHPRVQATLCLPPTTRRPSQLHEQAQRGAAINLLSIRPRACYI